MQGNVTFTLKKAVITGVKQGWGSFIWMVEIIVPVSFVMAILQWSGWLDNVNSVMAPAMSFLRLPPEAALPIISGVLINIYAVVAILAVVPFTIEQMTLIAIFTLVAHNMIIEGIIQHRSGINVIKATLLRLITAIVLVFIISHFFSDTMRSVTITHMMDTQPGFFTMMRSWGIDTVILLLKIFGIIMFIMILLQIAKSCGWIARLERIIRPVTRVLGFSSSLATIYVAGIVFGIMYGGAVIIEEEKKEHLDRQEIRYLHASLGINHSMIEDPALFVMLGVNLLWLWIPRLLMAIAVVQGYRAIKRLRGKFIFNSSRH